jgi:hypothetical protein
MKHRVDVVIVVTVVPIVVAPHTTEPWDQKSNSRLIFARRALRISVGASQLP